MFESLRLSDLQNKNCGILRGPSSTRPVIWHIEEDGVEALVKDFHSHGFLFRNTVGRFLIWRESKAYRRLKGLKGVPAFFGVIDGLALILEEIEGRNVELLERKTRLPVHFFEALRHLVEQVHSRGLVHCDLKRAPNIMIDRNGDPCIVDWSAAISKSEMRVFPLDRLYRRFIKDDFNAVIKLQLRHRPEALDDKTLKQYYYRSRAERLIRKIRDRARDLLQRIA
ncbi:MAG: hypothetical protein JRJ85_05760 [Deltaproteobacteria bacterium]|nr:hypothetical protein [Deltaproteobacteria bacterium]